jgi:hypothetical protein
MVRPAARLQNHFRSGQLTEKRFNLAALEFPPEHPLLLINTVQRKNMLSITVGIF